MTPQNVRNSIRSDLRTSNRPEHPFISLQIVNRAPGVRHCLMSFLFRIILCRPRHNITREEIQHMNMTGHAIIRIVLHRYRSLQWTMRTNPRPLWRDTIQNIIIHSCLIICNFRCQVRRTLHRHNTQLLHMNKSQTCIYNVEMLYVWIHNWCSFKIRDDQWCHSVCLFAFLQWKPLIYSLVLYWDDQLLLRHHNTD